MGGVRHALRLSLRALRGVLVALLLVLFPIGSVMAGEREADVLRAIPADAPFEADLFAPSFLAAVPEAQLRTVVEQVRGQVGAVTSVTVRGQGRYVVETATHSLPVQIALDADGRVTGLLFRPAVAHGGTLDSVITEMEALAPAFGLLVTRNGEVLAARDADRPLAVGSAFKLGVLGALQREIAAGRRQWSDVVTLAATDRSLPSGTLQTWPVGSPVTLHTLAALMISISDNTATDALIRVLGREQVEAVLGIAPVLTTRELFTLKARSVLRDRYLTGDLAAQRQVLAELAEQPLPDVSQVGTPYDPGMEWLLSAATLCGLVEDVAGLDVMSINPGVADSTDWAHVAFKGGSEIGVLNLTTQLTAADGTRFCVAATWNGPSALEEGRASAAYASLVGILRRE